MAVRPKVVQSAPPVMTEIPKWYRAIDPMNAYLLHPQVAPKGFRPLKAHIQGRLFPGQHYSEIWGYEIGIDSSVQMQEGCEQLAANGTLCPNVVYPGKLLDAAQTSQLMSIAEHPVDSVETVVNANGSGHTLRRARLRCGEPVAMFIFFDAGHRPVGIVSVDEGCVQWGFLPAPKDAWAGLACVTENEGQVLRQLCAELDFPSCSGASEYPSYKDADGNPRYPTSEERAAPRRALLPLLLKQLPDIDENKSLAETSENEQKALCAWYARSAAIANQLFNDYGSWGFSGAAFEDEKTHRAIRLTSFEQCMDEFPHCDGSIKQARGCITRHLEHFWNQDETCSLECVWGLSSTLQPRSKAPHTP